MFYAEELQQLRLTEECLKDAGWDINDSVLAEYHPKVAREEGTSFFDSTRRTLEFETGEREVSPLWDDPAFIQSSIQCHEKASEETVSAVSLTVALLDDTRADISKSVQASEAYRQAERSLDSCLSDLGWSQNALVDAANQDVQSVEQLMSRYDSGSLTANAAVDELNAIEAASNDRETLVAPCTQAYADTEQQIRTEIEAAYLAAHPGLIQAIVEQTAEARQALEEFLPE